VEEPVPDFTAGLETGLAGLRIGVPKEFFGAGLGDDIARVVRESLAVYEKLGARLIEVSLPNAALAVPCYYVLAPCEASSNLARFDGVRYGHRAGQYDDLRDMYGKTRAEGFGAEVKRRIMIGTYALSAGYYDAYYLKALKLRRLIAQDFERVFADCDLLAGPTTPTTAFALGEKSGDPVAMYLNDIYTIPVNLAGLPAISIPAGFDASARPVGLQLIGRYFDEARLLNAAHRYQSETDWHERLPEGYA
jgi:aspartyl-tRNA(Asn)/glutamyl-tRNA(Gln) amidotransferase subunit A